MKKTLKRLGAAFLAGALVAAMAVPAMADNNTLTNGKSGELYGSNNEGLKQNNTLVFNKEIIIYNTASETVHNPNVTYTYSIEPANITDEAQTVTDGDGDVGKVYKGITDAASITASVAFSSTDTTATTTDGAVASKPITVTIDPTKFTHAGIYRYLITEGDNSTARTAAGVARTSTYADKRYLDVYVRKDVNNEDPSSDYVVYGYVLFEHTTPAVDISETTPVVTKSNGYVATATSGKYTTATNVDYYNTYNLNVVKKVKGTLADKNEDFPFEIAFSNSTISAQPVVTASGQLTGDQTFAAAGTLTLGAATASGTLKLKEGENVLIVGIPADITSTVTEYNSSYDVYKTNITDTAVTGGTATHTTANVNPGTTTAITAVKGTNTSTTNALTAGNLVLTVTNEIEVVSPTGVALRFAPYVLMLVAGLAILLVGHKRREED